MSQERQTSRTSCSDKTDMFCYVCAKFETSDCRRSINDWVKSKYLECYNIPMKNLDKVWVPRSICNSCRMNFKNWKQIKKEVIIQPALWREPKNHHDDCYFCACNVTGRNKKNKQNIVYPSVESVTPAKKGNVEIEISKNTDSDQSDSEEIVTDENETECAYECPSDDTNPILFNQNDLDDLIRDLNLPKDSSELLASRLKERNLLLPGTKITIYRKRHEEFLKFFASNDSMVYCNDIKGLMSLYKTDMYEPANWRIFIDSSKESLKAVLLHNGNEYAAVPIGHSTILKESYESLKCLLDSVNYNLHQWRISGDFKMINLLVGLQSGNVKYPCFLCLWDSRDRHSHWIRKDWPKRSEWKVGSHNVINKSLVDLEKILLPPLHIKLGLMKQFVKALNKDGNCYKYIKATFPNLSDAKTKEGVFVGPDIRKLMKDDEFEKSMTKTEKNAWFSFKEVVYNFLGNYRDTKYETIVSTMLSHFRKLGCLMSLKLHYLFSHLDYFPENVGAFSEEMGERFHQDLKEKERHYQGRWDTTMMADYCWSLKRNDELQHHSRRSQKRSFECKRERFHKRKKI